MSLPAVSISLASSGNSLNLIVLSTSELWGTAWPTQEFTRIAQAVKWGDLLIVWKA